MENVDKTRRNRWLSGLYITLLILSLINNLVFYKRHRTEIAALANEQKIKDEFRADNDRKKAREVAHLLESCERQLLRASFEGRPIDVTGVTADGTPFDWQSLRGKPVLLHCWSASCDVCQNEFEAVEQLRQACQAVELQVIGLSQDLPVRNKESAKELIEHKVQWINLIPTEKTRPRINGVWVKWPSTFLIVDANGVALSVISNPLQPSKEANDPSRTVPGAKVVLSLFGNRTGPAGKKSSF